MFGEVVTVLALVSLAAAQDVVEFSCENRPIGKSETNGHVMKISFPQEEFKHNQDFTVVVETVVEEDHFRHLGIQARDVSGQLVGTWEIPSGWEVRHCAGGQMLYSPANIDLPSVTLTWVAPTGDWLQRVEFHVTAMLDSDTYRMLKTQLLEADESAYNPHDDPSEFEEPAANDDDEVEGDPAAQENPDGEQTGNPGENPNGGEELYGEMAERAEELDNAGGDEQPQEEPEVDLHDPATENQHYQDLLAHQQELIDKENRNSEGNWSVIEEQERRREEEEYDWEMTEYERVQYEQERKREEIMLWEIRDKEEHDAMVANQTPVPPTEVNNDTEDSSEESDEDTSEESDEDTSEELDEDTSEEIDDLNGFSSEEEALEVGDGVGRAASSVLLVLAALLFFMA